MTTLRIILISFLLLNSKSQAAGLCADVFNIPPQPQIHDLIRNKTKVSTLDLKNYILSKLPQEEQLEFSNWWNTLDAKNHLSKKSKPVSITDEADLSRRAIQVIRQLAIQQLKIKWKEKLKKIYSDPLRLYQATEILEQLTAWETPLRPSNASPSWSRRGLRVAKSVLFETTKDWILDPEIKAGDQYLRYEAAIGITFRYWRNTASTVSSTIFMIIAFQLLNQYLMSADATHDELGIAAAEELLARDANTIKAQIQEKIHQLDPRLLSVEQREFLLLEYPQQNFADRIEKGASLLRP